MFGAFSGRATSTAAVGVVHDSFISYSDGRRHRWSHNPFCVNRHDIFQNSTAEQRQFNETPSQRHVFCGKRHDPAVSASSRTRRQRCECRPHAKSQPNQQRAPPRNGRAGQKARGRRGGIYPATRGECACPAWDDTECTHTSHGSNGHVSREGGRNNRSILRRGGEQLEAACGEPAKQPRHPAQTGTVREPRAPPHPTRKRSKCSNETPRNGKIRVSCMIRGVCAAKRSPSWQDLRAVYSRKAICRAFRIHGARILPKSAHFGCMAAICCQEGALFPSEAPFGIHEAQNLPRIAARERTRAKYCHRQAPENAPWRHGAGRRHANKTSANSTPHADTSKKP